MNTLSPQSTGIIVLMKCLQLGGQAVTENIFLRIFYSQSKLLFSFTNLKLYGQ